MFESISVLFQTDTGHWKAGGDHLEAVSLNILPIDVQYHARLTLRKVQYFRAVSCGLSGRLPLVTRTLKIGASGDANGAASKYLSRALMTGLGSNYLKSRAYRRDRYSELHEPIHMVINSKGEDDPIKHNEIAAVDSSTCPAQIILASLPYLTYISPTHPQQHTTRPPFIKHHVTNQVHLKALRRPRAHLRRHIRHRLLRRRSSHRARCLRLHLRLQASQTRKSHLASAIQLSRLRLQSGWPRLRSISARFHGAQSRHCPEIRNCRLEN